MMIKDTKLNKFVNPIINGKKIRFSKKKKKKQKFLLRMEMRIKIFLIDIHMCNRHLNINYSGIFFCCLGMFMFNSSWSSIWMQYIKFFFIFLIWFFSITFSLGLINRQTFISLSLFQNKHTRVGIINNWLIDCENHWFIWPGEKQNKKKLL